MKNIASNKTFIARQGDVLIERIESLPGSALKKLKRENGRVILAHAEVTGHAHAISDAGAALFESETSPGVTFLEIKEAMAALQHDEHSTIALEPGSYRITRQKEYTPQEIRNVAD